MISPPGKGQDYFWAATSGILLALSFPNFDLWPLAWFFLVPLLWCIRGKSGKDAFILGVFAGLIAYLGLLYWIVVAVHRYGNIPLPLTIPILILLVLYLSLYWGAFSYLTSYFHEKEGWISILALPAIWVGLEYLRSFLLSGFPWALLGYSQYLNITLVQIADITGIYGVSFFLVLTNTLIFLWLAYWRGKGELPLKGSLFALALLVMVFAYGVWKVHFPLSNRRVLKVAVVQGNIAQDVKWDKRFQKRTLEIYRKLTLGLMGASPGLIVWPETALPSYFPSGTELDGEVLAIPKEVDAYLLFGSLYCEKGEKGIEVYNSAYLLSPASQILGRYDKIHLVPFGEYVPLSRFFPFFNSLVGIGNISPGEDAVIFQLPEGRFGVLICFEVIFPELCREFVRRGADFMVTITNDAWFGKTSAPYQHLAQATFRSVENRIWLVRAANTGISAFIDPWGRVHKASNIFTRETFLQQISLKDEGMTFYTRYGDVFALGCSLLGIGLISYILLKSRWSFPDK
ncbi:MAG: apolipoprotein N-acyltransferase [Deltaproteobacteria bacterium]|nr:MAG: apolipoprotein N-acyltransferase [Deltaproteobacteria bacterium]